MDCRTDLDGKPEQRCMALYPSRRKMMKGLLRSLSTEYDHGHELKELLNAVEPLMVLQPETIKNILYLNGFSVSLRYKHMSTDPSAEEAKVTIVRTK